MSYIQQIHFASKLSAYLTSIYIINIPTYKYKLKCFIHKLIANTQVSTIIHKSVKNKV